MVARGFRAPRYARPIASLALVVSMTSCTHMALTAPTKSIITLYASGSPASDGSIKLIATVIEEAGTPVQNGTLVTFTTTLGHLDPTSAETTNGQATVKFFGAGLSGTATVSAFSGGATSGSGSAAGNAATVTIDLGGAAANNIVIGANPSSLPVSGGPVTIIARVRDASGTGQPNVLVVFSTTAGSFPGSSQSASVSTDSTGTATTTLTTTTSATVTAAAGGQTATVDVNVAAAATIK